MKRVYDDRTNETLFKGEWIDCVSFIGERFDDVSKDFPHIWIGNVEEGRETNDKEVP